MQLCKVAATVHPVRARYRAPPFPVRISSNKVTTLFLPCHLAHAIASRHSAPHTHTIWQKVKRKHKLCAQFYRSFFLLRSPHSNLIYRIGVIYRRRRVELVVTVVTEKKQDKQNQPLALLWRQRRAARGANCPRISIYFNIVFFMINVRLHRATCSRENTGSSAAMLVANYY